MAVHCLDFHNGFLYIDGYKETIDVQCGDMAYKEEVDVKAEDVTLEEERYSADQER